MLIISYAINHIWRQCNANIRPIFPTVARPAAWILHPWNVALFSDGATDSELTDKEEFPNLVRLNAPYNKMGPACVEIMKVRKAENL